MIFAMILLFMLISIKIDDKIEAYIYSFTVWTVYMFIIVELLSAFSAISTLSVWLVWESFDVVLLFVWIFCRKKCSILIARRIGGKRVLLDLKRYTV